MPINIFPESYLTRRRFFGRLPAIVLPFLFKPAPPSATQATNLSKIDEYPFPEYRLTPHYRMKSPIDAVIRLVQPGLDAFPTEKYAQEAEIIFSEWKKALEQSPPKLEVITKSLSPELQASHLMPSEEKQLRPTPGLEVFLSHSFGQQDLGKEAFVNALRSCFEESSLLNIETKVTAIRVMTTVPLIFQTSVRYEMSLAGAGFFREGRVGVWELEWEKDPNSELWIRRWKVTMQTRSRSLHPIFTDITFQSLGENSSYREQLLRGVDHWRTVLDAACGIDVYGNNGVAVGDIDNDGFDDLYVCQPSGLPNRLYQNRGDGTFADITAAAGVDVLGHTACAFFADLDNDGKQDLLVVCSNGPLLFLNQGNGKFRLRKDAFIYAQPPQGTFTGAAIADFDRDGKLDIYFSLYSYYQGLDQYRFPTPYHDAQNGPPNFFFRNNGNGTFRDVTASTGLNQNNNRYSFACGWSDYNNDGRPDLYVANDFGRNNLYRNNGDGTFTDVALEVGVEDIGAGMSVCWFDYDNDGKQDLYVANMWTAEGQRVAMQGAFMNQAPETVRGSYRKHASGNSLFHNEENGRFQEKNSEAGVEMGRWAWSSDAWDFDHDGYADLYVANGMISGPDKQELNSFFWRQVVPHSPVQVQPEKNYEQGWNAINELIRSDGTWSGYERNIFYANNRDGTFSDVSVAVGLDFPEDGRAFALTDIDHDGRLEIILKNRNSPQIRILRNQMLNLGHSIAFRLRGHRSNRDAIGTLVTMETDKGAQSKFLQAGSGFLSQHTKELFFGLGHIAGPVRATVRWPSGRVQKFDELPINCRVEIEEGVNSFRVTPFVLLSPISNLLVTKEKTIPLPSRFASWLITPLDSPDFGLTDFGGHVRTLQSFRGRKVLLNFWAIDSPECLWVLETFQQNHSQWATRGLHLATVNVDDASHEAAVRAFVLKNRYSFLVLLGNDDVTAIYNILYRYLFDRRRNLALPSSFLLDETGAILKVYQGFIDIEDVLGSIVSIPRTAAERIRNALPFSGHSHTGEFHRNTFNYGVAYYEKGYFDQAIASFQAALRDSPDYPEAHYNLGTLYLKKQMRADARAHFQTALKIRPEYPDALNNLGLIAAEENRFQDALRYFQESIQQKPANATALLNLGNLYRQHDRFQEAEQAIKMAFQFEPEDPEVNYSLGMLFAQKEDTERARDFLQKAIKLRPDYSQALNNLGVLYLRMRRPAEAIPEFRECIRVDTRFDQPYLNLARAYVATGDRQKAQESLQDLLKIYPNHSMAQKMLEQLGR